MRKVIMSLNAGLLLLVPSLSLVALVTTVKSAKSTVTGPCPTAYGTLQTCGDKCNPSTYTTSECGGSTTEGCCQYSCTRVRCRPKPDSMAGECGAAGVFCSFVRSYKEDHGLPYQCINGQCKVVY